MTVISTGGGGIPVIRQGNHLKGAAAVVDKDWASARLAELIDADLLIILTAVEKVAINFGKPEQEWLDFLSVADAQRYLAAGHFAKGSMLPKVQAALHFAERLYRSLALGLSVDEAVSWARLHVMDDSRSYYPSDWGRFMVYMPAESSVLFPPASDFSR